LLPVGVIDFLLPAAGKDALFSLASGLFGPPGWLRKQTFGEKVGKFVALRLELG